MIRFTLRPGEERRLAMAGPRTLEIPEAVLLSARSLDDLEDRLATRDADFLAEMRRIRRGEDLVEQGKNLGEVLKRWPIKS
jgi:hypothetical protein